MEPVDPHWEEHNFSLRICDHTMIMELMKNNVNYSVDLWIFSFSCGFS